MSADDVRSVRTLELVAPAKVNLVLEVIGRRSDGYHNIDTVMTTVDLADRVRITPHSQLDVSLTGEHAAGIAEADEISARAAQALAVACGREPCVRIEVQKRIPHAAGLGGGSSDAAAVLRGLNALWDLDWPLERLEAVAAAIGSDVPFFLHGGVARCTGRGERVEPLRDLRTLQMILLVPPLPPQEQKTARRFSGLTHADFSSGERSRRVAHRIERGGPPPASDFMNAFEAVIERGESELLAHYGAYRAAGAPMLHLTGAGPTAFLLVHANARASELRRDFEAVGARALSVRTLSRRDALAVRELEGGGSETEDHEPSQRGQA